MQVSRIEYFDCVLSLIKNKDIRDLCEILLNDADDYFFSEPASSTGKYHPKYALGKGGLARHSIAVALIINEIISTGCYNFSDNEKDLLIVAAIVHDIKKYGNGGSYTVKNHPELAVEFIEEHFHYTKLSSDDFDFLENSIISHMGQWGKTKPETDSQKLLHIADCLASRKYIEIDFDNDLISGSTNVNENTVKPLEKPGEFIMPFGKYKGKCIRMIYEIDEQYLEWLTNKSDIKPGKVTNKIKEYLEEQKR